MGDVHEIIFIDLLAELKTIFVPNFVTKCSCKLTHKIGVRAHQMGYQTLRTATGQGKSRSRMPMCPGFTSSGRI